MRRDHANALRDILLEIAERPVSVVISGDCMEPHLPAGRRVAVRVQRWYWPGDVLVFFSPSQGGLLAHRLLGAYRRSGHWRLLTRADNASRPDSALEPCQILGRVVEPSVSLAQRLIAVSRFLAYCWSGLCSLGKKSMFLVRS